MIWNPIETAKKDGSRIYGCDADGWRFITYWEPWFSGPSGNWVCEGRIETEYDISRLAYWNPTLWTELPDDPEGV